MFFLALLACSPDRLSAAQFAAGLSEEEAFPGSRITGEGTALVWTGPDSAIEIPYVVQEGMAVAQDDMILGDPAQLADRAAMQRDPSFLWPCSVPYRFDVSLSDQARQDFRDAADHWESHTELRFVEDPAAEDLLHIRGGNGCSAQVGRNGGAQRMKLSSTCGVGAAIHEIGHAVGMFHENARIDAASHVQVIWENVRPGKEHNFRSWAQRGYDGIDVGPYDFDSIMHYGSWFFRPSGTSCTEDQTEHCTILRRDGGYIHPNRSVLSQGDIDAIANRYGHCRAGQITSDQGDTAEDATPFESGITGELEADDSDVFTWVVDAPSWVSLHTLGDASVALEVEGETEFYYSPIGGHDMAYGPVVPGTYTITVSAERAGDYTLLLGDGEVFGRPDNPIEVAHHLVMQLVNQASVEELDVEIGLDRRAAEGIVEERARGPIVSLHTLDAIPYVGPTAFDRLFEAVGCGVDGASADNDVQSAATPVTDIAIAVPGLDGSAVTGTLDAGSGTDWWELPVVPPGHALHVTLYTPGSDDLATFGREVWLFDGAQPLQPFHGGVGGLPWTNDTESPITPTARILRYPFVDLGCQSTFYELGFQVSPTAP